MSNALSNTIAEYLSANIDDYKCTATPLATVAPFGYYVLPSGGVILVWVDSANYQPHRPKTENNYLRSNHHVKKTYRLVFSIGQRNLAELPTLDAVIETVETLLINLKLQDYSLFTPVAMSKMSVDENKVYWRQCFYETTIKLVVDVHEIEEDNE